MVLALFGTKNDLPFETAWFIHQRYQFLLSEKRREAKGKGEKERHTHLNAEFQRVARRGKKAFLGDQCKKIEENNRMRMIRYLF